MPVAARAADIDGAGRRLDRDHPLAHCACRLGYFDRGFAAFGQTDQKGGDGVLTGPSVENIGKGRRRAFA